MPRAATGVLRTSPSAARSSVPKESETWESCDWPWRAYPYSLSVTLLDHIVAKLVVLIIIGTLIITLMITLVIRNTNVRTNSFLNPGLPQAKSS